MLLFGIFDVYICRCKDRKLGCHCVIAVVASVLLNIFFKKFILILSKKIVNGEVNVTQIRDFKRIGVDCEKLKSEFSAIDNAVKKETKSKTLKIFKL